MQEPVILPRQANGPLDPTALGKQPKEPLTSEDVRNLRFQKDWYLFFHAAQEAATTGNGIVQFGTSATRKALNTQGLANGTLWIETDTGLTYQWRVTAASMGWVFAAGTQVIDKTLTVASTTIAVPTTGAVDLVVILRQDGTGGRAVVWGAGFSAASVNIDTTLSTVSTFRFVLSGGTYVQTGQQTTGMTP